MTDCAAYAESRPGSSGRAITRPEERLSRRGEARDNNQTRPGQCVSLMQRVGETQGVTVNLAAGYDI